MSILEIWLAIISVAGTAIAVGMIWQAVIMNHQASQITKLEANTDGMREQLVHTTNLLGQEIGFAKGLAIGKEEERDRRNKELASIAQQRDAK